MSWHARLQLSYAHAAPRTVVRFLHEGPLRVLQSLYPEGEGICHNVLVHPPGGIVGGDQLEIEVDVAAGAHGLITTPGASRFYRSQGETGLQTAQLRLQAGARLEWLPLEAICYSGCLAENRLRCELAPGAELLGWDVTALGLPHADQPFERGRLLQHLEVPGVWLERGHIAAEDRLLLDGPLGLAGQRCLATVFFVAGSALTRERREQALEAARTVIEAHGLSDSAGATSPHDQVLVVRILGPVVEPVMDLARRLRAAWREQLWAMPGLAPRIWAM